MKDEEKTKSQLIKELKDLRQKFKQLSGKTDQSAQNEMMNRHLETLVEERTRELGKINKLLEENQRQLQTFLDHAPAVLFSIDKDGIFSLSEGKGLEKLGLKPGQIVGMSVFDIYKNFPDILDSINLALNGKTTRAIHNNLHTIYDVLYTPCYDDQNRIEGVIGIAVDITEQKQAEEKLRQNQQMLETMINTIPDLAWLKDKDSRFISVNVPFGEVYGIKPGDLVGKTDLDIWPKKLAMKYRNDDKEVMSSGKRKWVEEKLVDQWGTESWVESIKSAVFNDHGEIIGTAGIARNITERKVAEIQLQESEERYRSLIEAFPDIVLVSDYEGKLLYANPALERQTGLTFDDLQNEREKNPFIHPEDAPNVRKALGDFIISNKKYSDLIENRLVDKKGRLHWYSGIAAKIRYNGVPALQVISRDITERKLAEDALRSSEERYRTLVEISPDAITLTNMNNIFLMVNPQAVKTYGFKNANEMIGIDAMSLVAPEQRALTDEIIQHVVESGVPGYYEIIYLRKDGSRFPGEVNVTLLKNAENEPVFFISIIRDTTERKKLEDELVKAAKLESIGILAGGIAHDFNNLLSAIVGNISIAKMECRPEEKMYRRLTEAEKASFRAKDLTQQLLTFSKGGMPVKGTIYLKNIITDAVNFTLSGSNVKCDFTIPENLWPVEADEGQIIQVINNIVINADQSMPRGGQIKITGKNITLRENSILPLRKGRYVKISISDRGIGIDEDHILQIFDPYFTTKQKGSGLGLATAYSIIKKHNGYLDVESVLKKGTTFNLFLPASSRKPFSKSGEKSYSGNWSGKILIMDDEEIILDYMENLLITLGFNVLTARDGKETIGLYKKEKKGKNPVDLVIMDLTVPGGMGGKETVAELIKIDPEVKAIVSSGYSNDPVMSDFAKYGFINVLSKPFRVQELKDVLEWVFEDKTKTNK